MSVPFQNTTTGDSGTIGVSSTLTGATQINPGFKEAFITVVFSAISGSSPSLSIKLQYSPDEGTTWENFSNTMNRTDSSTSDASVVYVFKATGANIYSMNTMVVAASMPSYWRIVIQNNGDGSVTLSNVYINYLS